MTGEKSSLAEIQTSLQGTWDGDRSALRGKRSLVRVQFGCPGGTQGGSVLRQVTPTGDLRDLGSLSDLV